MQYQNKDTGEILSHDDMYQLYRCYIDNNIIDDYGFDDFLDGATDVNGLYVMVDVNRLHLWNLIAATES